jgi:hypothetical protein
MDIDMSGFGHGNEWPTLGPVPRQAQSLAILLDDQRFNLILSSLTRNQMNEWLLMGIAMVETNSDISENKTEISTSNASKSLL